VSLSRFSAAYPFDQYESRLWTRRFEAVPIECMEDGAGRSTRRRVQARLHRLIFFSQSVFGLSFIFRYRVSRRRRRRSSFVSLQVQYYLIPHQ